MKKQVFFIHGGDAYSKYEEWSLWFSRHFPYLRDGVDLIGWSLGGMFLAKYLAENFMPIKPNRVFLLAAPCGFFDSEDGNDLEAFNLSKIHSIC